MDKQKQIEEMKKDIAVRMAMAKCVTGSMNNGVEGWLSEYLIGKGWAKIPEGAVVLTEKKYQRYNRIEKIIKLAKREKANGYEVKNGKLYYFSNMLGGCEIEFKDLKEICDMANHYNEEFWGLDQRLAFWQGKAETIGKETAEKFAEKFKEKMAEVWGGLGKIPTIEFAIIDEVCKEITEGKKCQECQTKEE